MNRRETAAVLPLAAAALALSASFGCHRQRTAESLLTLELEVSPSPPRIGEAKLTIQLSDARGVAVQDATLRIEGTMSHAGMSPEFADAAEVAPGRYEATLEFTMGGDWILLVDATTPDGAEHHWQRDVPNVSSSVSPKGGDAD